MKKLFLSLAVITILFVGSSVVNTNKAEAYYGGYSNTYCNQYTGCSTYYSDGGTANTYYNRYTGYTTYYNNYNTGVYGTVNTYYNRYTGYTSYYNFNN